MNNLAEVCLVGLRVGGNYVRCLVVVVITMRFGGAKRCEGSLKSSFCVCVCVCVCVCGRGGGGGGGTSHKEGPVFMGELSPLYTMKEVLTM